MTDDRGVCSPVMTFRRTPWQRAWFLGFALAGTVGSLVLVAEMSRAMVLFGLAAGALMVDGLRARVDIDRNRGVVIATRAFGRRVVPIADIVNVRSRRRGPAVLTLRPEAAGFHRGILAGQVVTGLYPEILRSDSIASRLAGALGVPLV